MANEWISVKDGLPTGGVYVLVVYNGVVQHALYWRDDGDGEWTPADSDMDSAPEGTFSHWMPLPEAPK